MKHTILKKWMVILVITFLYFNTGIEGMKEEQDKHYNLKESVLKHKPKEVVDAKDQRKNCYSRFKGICNNLTTNCHQLVEYYSNFILSNPTSENHNPLNEIFDDNIQHGQQATLRYGTRQNSNILNPLNPEPLFYNINLFETQTTKQPDKDLALLTDKLDLKEEEEKKNCNICFEKYKTKMNISGIELNAGNLAKRKIILPCCKKDLCNNCKSGYIEKQKSKGLEIFFKAIYEIKQIKCMRCPFCCSLIPQKESDNGSLWEIQNNSIKLHEKIESLRTRDEKTVASIIQEALYDPDYCRVLKEKIQQEDQQLFEEISIFYSLDLNY